MSHSSNPESSVNIFSELSSLTVNNKINSTTTERAPKRAADDDLGGETKKVMIEHHLKEEKTSDIVRKSPNESKFISASMIVNTARNNLQTIPEISDEDLLRMTLEFEKKYPQL